MCTNQQTGRPFNLAQAQTVMRCAVFGASILMAALAAIGAGTVLSTGGELDGHLVAYGAGLIAIGAAFVMIIAIGALAVNLTVLRHQRAVEKNIVDHLDELARDIANGRQELAAGREELAAQREELAVKLDGRLDEIEDQHVRLEKLMDRVSTNQQKEAVILGSVIEGTVRTLHVRDGN